LSDTFNRIQSLVLQDADLVSNHAYDGLVDDWIVAEDVLIGLATAEVIEDYPDAVRGPSVLVLLRD
jgi:hypothetical protein